jgi:putative transposase
MPVVDGATTGRARMAVFSYIEGWYNPARRHSGIGYLSPIAYERQMLSETETT